MTTAQEENKFTVSLAVDDRMVYGLLVLAGSLVRTSSHKPRLIVGFFPQVLSTGNQNLISRFFDWLDIEWEFIKSTPHPLFTERRHLTITTFSKFILADEIAQAHLWLDLDTIVLEGWEEIFSEIVEAGPDTRIVVARMLESTQTRFSGFNAGVLGWTSSPREHWVEALASLPKKRFSSEQLLFNQLYGTSAKEIDVSFNFLSSWHDDLDGISRPKIVHYSGPVKPWHLARRHREAWKRINSTWEMWFEAEDILLEELRSTRLLQEVLTQRRKALFSGRLHSGKGALAGWVLRGLVLAGPLGKPIVKLLSKRRQT